MAQRKPHRKVRCTFTLSPENVAYIEQQTRRRKLASLSAFLDELLREKTREQKLAEIEANTIAYYDSLTDEEVEEQRAWGEFAGQTLVLTEEELAHAQSAARGDLVHKIANRPSGQRKAPGRHRLGQRAKQSPAS
ncbi:MAG: hypothetical protein WBS24_09590 [Terriglobales bacterium]